MRRVVAAAPNRAPYGKGRGAAIALGLVMYALVLALNAPAAPAAEDRYRGRLLTDVLADLRARGLKLIYSSELVGADTVVAREPEATDPRALLAELLEPLGLEARSD